MADAPQKTLWQAIMESLNTVRADPKVKMATNTFMGPISPMTVLPGVVGGFFNQPIKSTPKASPSLQPALPPVQLEFPADAAAITPGAAAGNPPSAREMVESMFPGITVTSENRTAADQERLKKQGYKPAERSAHRADLWGPGKAVDFVPPKGADAASMVAQLNANGMWAYYDNKRGHIHADLQPMGTRTVLPTVAPGDTTNAGGIQTVDPRLMMGMVPQPRMLPQVNLPNAVQREAPGEVPLADLINEAMMLAPLAEAMKVKERDKKFDKWDRVAAMLANAAAAGSRVSPNAGTGQFLLAAGGGAGAGFQAERKEQRELDMQEDEAKRQVQIALSKMGFDIKLSNLKTTNENKDRKFRGDEAKKDVNFANASANDARNIQEILFNAGVTQRNIGELNEVDRVRANVGIGGLQANASAVNQANARQTELNVRGAAAAASDETIDKDLLALGLDPKSKDPLQENARQTYIAAKAKNPQQAFAGLARELVLSGRYKTELSPDDAKLIERSSLDSKGKLNVDAAAAAVNQSLTTLMADPKTAPAVLEMIDKLGQEGLPSAMIISQKRKRSAAAVKPK